MKSVSKTFINEMRKETGTKPVLRISMFAKYPGPIRAIATSCHVINGVVARSISVYGNASRFFNNADNLIIKSTPLTNLGTLVAQPVFDGLETTLQVQGIYLTQDNVGGYVLRDIDYKFSVGAT